MFSGEGGRGRAWHYVSETRRQAGRCARGRTAGCSPRGLRSGRSRGVRRAVPDLAPPAGFVLAEARRGDYLVGFAAGIPLRPSTSRRKDLTAPLPAEITTEHPDRTFALTELLVRASWRRQGIAGSLHDLILDGRPEERATLTVPPGAAAAQKAFRKWGWSRVARTRGPDPRSPVLDVLIITLPAGHPWTR